MKIELIGLGDSVIIDAPDTGNYWTDWLNDMCYRVTVEEGDVEGMEADVVKWMEQHNIPREGEDA